MNRHLEFLTVIFVFIASLGIISSQAHAQGAALSEDWCSQQSTVVFRVNENWTERIGRAEGGIRAVYQPYNQRIVLQSTKPREVLQVIEEGVTVSRLEVLRYTANCRYLIAVLRDLDGQYSTVAYDLTDNAAVRMGTVLNSGRNQWTVESSPEGTYLLVTALDGLYLWNLTSNTQTHLTALVRSDCELAGSVGCSGELSAYREARWDVPHGLLQLDLVTDYTVTLNLPSATINRVEATPRYVYSIPTPSNDQLATAATAYTSEYACQPRVQYQSYNRRVVMVERYAHQLVAVVENDLDLTGFQFLGWSPTCAYIAAAIEDASGLRLAVWDVQTMTRREHPLSDWVDSASWDAAGTMLNVRTDGGSFTWNIAS